MIKKLLCLISISIITNIFLSTKWLKVSRIPVKISNLPKNADGLKILQISDLHSNSEKKMNINIWKAIKSLEFDIAVITGDIVNSRALELRPHIDNIKKLAAKTPVYFCGGNHDYLAGYEKIKAQLKAAGVTVLCNEKTDIKINNFECELIGLSDYLYCDHEKLDGLFNPYNTDIVRIVIAHQPQSFNEVKEYLPTLTIVGHTHGGQLRLPFFKTLFAPGQGIFPKYGYGLYDYLDSKLYVSKGIGHTFFKIRFWNRPEITILMLKELK